MDDVLVIGGGVIGLSLAWDLAKHGRSVHVIDQAEPGREASWAGAGILPPAKANPSQHPYEQLRGLACELHPQWAKDLKSLTGIDTGYRQCGSLHLARTLGEAAALAAWAALLRDEGIEVERATAADVGEMEPSLACRNDESTYSVAFLIPAEAQLRNPWHVRALVVACERAGVTVSPNRSITEFEVLGDRLIGVQTTAGTLHARQYCFTAGAWTGQILQRLDITTGILPIRGQMVLFRSETPPITRIVNEGSRYLVPRDDGRVLAGSTEEEVGFDKRTTEEAIADLTDFARGLFLSTATAVVMSQLMRGEEPRVNLAPFRVGR
jgi:glycine oxidase